MVVVEGLNRGWECEVEVCAGGATPAACCCDVRPQEDATVDEGMLAYSMPGEGSSSGCDRCCRWM